MPLPAWETMPPADIFRVFERGGRIIVEPVPRDRPAELARPIQRSTSRAGPTSGSRTAAPAPARASRCRSSTSTRRGSTIRTWFLGTNDQPGDYRSSGCSACHVVYANDRDPRHSGGLREFGTTATRSTADPTIPKDEPGHPIRHEFTRAIPSSQCMICHMHQPNMFVNTYLGYMMWDYESDAPLMWPEEQRVPDRTHEARAILDRNPEEAAIRGNWGDPEFLKQGLDRSQPQG